MTWRRRCATSSCGGLDLVVGEAQRHLGLGDARALLRLGHEAPEVRDRVEHLRASLPWKVMATRAERAGSSAVRGSAK